jgi:CBS domain containing-hemolysin-like protein
MTVAGHVLKPGEAVEYNGLVFKVEKVERRRVMRVHLTLSKENEESETATVEGARAAG